MDHINVAAAISRLPKVWDGQQRPSAQAATQLLQRLLAMLDADGGALAAQLGVRGLSNCIWAVAKLYEAGMEAPPHNVTRAALLLLLGWLSTAAASGELAAEAEPQELSNIAWALAKAAPVLLMDKAAEVKQLLDAVAHSALQQGLEGFKPQELSNLAWAYATVGQGQQHARLFAAIADAVVAGNKLAGFTPQNLTNLTWALAKSGVYEPRLFEAVARRICGMAAAGPLKQFEPQNISNAAYAYALVRHYDAALLSVLVEEACGRQLAGFKCQEVSNLLWALAQLNHSAGGAEHAAQCQRLCSMVDAQLLKRDCGLLEQGFNAQEVCNTAWALAVLGHPISSGLMTRLLEAADQLLAKQGLADEELVQLFYAAHLVPSLQARGRTPLQKRAQLFHACEAAHKNSVQQLCSGAADISTAHRDVHAVLTRGSAGGDGLGLQAQLEQPTADGYFAVNILVASYPGQQVAVEVDGPTRFAANEPQHELGRTALRNRLLRNRWPLACVRVDEWLQLAPAHRVAWLRTQLDAAVQQGQQAGGATSTVQAAAAETGINARSSGSAVPSTRSGTPLPLERPRRPLFSPPSQQ